MSDPWRVPLFRPTIGPLEEAAALRVLRSGWLTTGHEVAAFELEMSQEVGTEFAVATSSGTHAMKLALMGLNIGSGDEVITTPITFAATAAVIIDVGATPVFADVHEETGNLSMDAVAEAITPRTRAVLPVHLGGRPVDHCALAELALEHDLAVIEDAAHGLEVVSSRDALPASAACFSFYASKNMTTGEGGMLVTNDASLAERSRRLRCHGMSRTIMERHDSSTPWSYDIPEAGLKANMADLPAAMGRAQLSQVPEWHRRRIEIVRNYIALLGDIEEIVVPSLSDDDHHAWHLFTIRMANSAPRDLRDNVLRSMTSDRIGCSIHFRPIFELAAYRHLFDDDGASLPGARSWSERSLSLPLFPTMTHEDVLAVTNALKQALTLTGGRN